MKYEWKKAEKELYGAKGAPALVEVPAQRFLIIHGTGDPNGADFSQRVAVLYSLAYGVKMRYKASAARGEISTGVGDYTVYPLEGVWEELADGALVKEKLEYAIMIRQPDFIGEELVAAALEGVKKKKPSPLLEEIRFEAMEDGLCLQILHTGPFDDEPLSFAELRRFGEEHGYERAGGWHREIYLTSANRVPKSKLRTILRWPVRQTP